jgi:hypothetical protein
MREGELQEADFFAPPDDFELFVEGRRRAIDDMIWQVPGLSVAAQAFLYVVALSKGTSDTVRIFAGTIGFLAAAATIQLLLKHRFHEETYAMTVDACRRRRGVAPLHGVRTLHEVALEEAKRQEHESARGSGYLHRWRPMTIRRRMAEPSSVQVWTLTLTAFALGDALIVIGAILHACGLSHPFG